MRQYGVSAGWVSKLLARWRREGEAAFEPRSRRPKTSPRATPAVTVELVLGLRKQLAEAGLDVGADTIGWHLQHHHDTVLSRATIHRILTRAGAVVPDPGKRPRSTYLRFAAEQPNECWQSDFTHYRVRGGGDSVERSPVRTRRASLSTGLDQPQPSESWLGSGDAGVDCSQTAHQVHEHLLVPRDRSRQGADRLCVQGAKRLGEFGFARVRSRSETDQKGPSAPGLPTCRSTRQNHRGA